MAVTRANKSLQAMKKEYPGVRMEYISTKQAKRTLDAIRRADYAVIVCGMSHSDEGGVYQDEWR